MTLTIIQLTNKTSDIKKTNLKKLKLKSSINLLYVIHMKKINLIIMSDKVNKV